MDFIEFKDMISYFDYPTDESYKLAYMWLHPEYIPKRQVTLGKHTNVYKFKPFVTNYDNPITHNKLYRLFNVPIIAFSKELFKNNSNITDIVLNKYISTLEESSFENCTNLKRIYLNKRITYIPKNCFKGCNDLEIYYEGSIEEFNKINVFYKKYIVNFKPGLYDDIEEYIIPGNEPFLNAKVHYNCNLDFSDEGICFAIKPILKIKKLVDKGEAYE